MAQQRQGVREVRYVWECDPGQQYVKSDRHMMNVITEALSRVNGVRVAVAFFDENGRRLSKHELYPESEATPELKKLVDSEFMEAEEVIGA
jgi:hypothetical protein